MFEDLSGQEKVLKRNLTIGNLLLILSSTYIAFKVSMVVGFIKRLYKASWLGEIAFFVTQYYWVILVVQIILVSLILLKWRTVYLGLKLNYILRNTTITIVVFIILGTMYYPILQIALRLWRSLVVGGV